MKNQAFLNKWKDFDDKTLKTLLRLVSLDLEMTYLLYSVSFPVILSEI